MYLDYCEIISPLSRFTSWSDSLENRKCTCFFFRLIPQGKDKGKGKSDGSHNYKKFFSCQKHCDIFVPFSQITPVALSSSSAPNAEPYAQPDTQELFVGDRVTYFATNKLRHGMVMDIQEKDGQTMVRVSTVSAFQHNHQSNTSVPVGASVHSLRSASRLFVLTVRRTRTKTE